jgi:hypothetical protein
MKNISSESRRARIEDYKQYAASPTAQLSCPSQLTTQTCSSNPVRGAFSEPQSLPPYLPAAINMTEVTHLPQGLLRRAKLILTRSASQDPPAKGPVTDSRPCGSAPTNPSKAGSKYDTEQ